MQYTLPLKQKQIEQTKLEAQARKESTLQNAEAAAQAKVIDSKAKFEASVLKQNPMLIQKIRAVVGQAANHDGADGWEEFLCQ